MTSLRHNADPQSGYLDAARACILDVGWRRTTLTEVARRAGVSRMTIYRAWPDMPAVLGDLMTREWSEVVARAVSDDRGEGRENLAGEADRGQRPGGLVSGRGLRGRAEDRLHQGAGAVGQGGGAGRVAPAEWVHLGGHALQCDT